MLCAMDVNWVRDYLLARHPLIAQVPVAVVAVALFWVLRSAKPPQRGVVNERAVGRWCVGIVVVAAGLLLAMASIYTRAYTFLDHVEPNVLGISQRFATGRPIYHPIDSAPRYKPQRQSRQLQ